MLKSFFTRLKEASVCVTFSFGLIYLSTFFQLGCGSGPCVPDVRLSCLMISHNSCDEGDSFLHPSDQEVQCCKPGSDDHTYTDFKDEIGRDPVLCRACQPALCATQGGTFAAGAAAALNANQALNNVNSFLGVHNEGTDPNQLTVGAVSQSSAASAGGTMEFGRNSKSSKQNSIAGATSPGAQFNPSSGSSGGGGSDNSTSPSISSAGSGGTNPSPSGRPSNGDALSNSLSQSQGSYAGKSMGGARSWGADLSGSRGTGIDGSAPSSVELNGRTTSSENAMMSTDPEDYFTRIGIELNLFKIVHSRYETQSRSWILNSSSQNNLSKEKKK